jgi:hypothetical protein
MTENPTGDQTPFELVRRGAAPEQRDELGFVTSDQPNLSAGQVKFILAAAAVHDNVEAAKLADVDLAELAQWFGDTEFNAVYTEFMRNKREGVKQIGQQITPLVLLELTRILQNGTNKEVIAAAKLIAQMQGMVITQNTPVDKGILEEIRQELMRPRPIQYKDVTKPS